MKKIEAIIRKTKFEDVKDALLEADIEWFSYYDVRGIGKARQGRIYRGVVYDTSTIERILIDQKFIVNYLVDVIVACIAGGIAMKNFLIRKRIVKRYQFGSFYMRMDIIAIVACVFIKIVTPAAYANFDITYLLLVISFFIMKRKIKPQFEAVI